MSEQAPTLSNEGMDPLTRSQPGPIIIVSGPSGAGKTTVSRLVATAFEPSVHLQTDAFMASVVNGFVDPWLQEAEHQHEAVGGALAVAAMEFASNGYTTVVDGHLFPRGVEGLAVACVRRKLSLHYVVLRADLDTCWARASGRPEGRWPLDLVRAPFNESHARFAQLGLYESHVVEATGNPAETAAAVLAIYRAGRLAVTAPPGDETE